MFKLMCKMDNVSFLTVSLQFSPEVIRGGREVSALVGKGSGRERAERSTALRRTSQVRDGERGGGQWRHGLFLWQERKLA